MSGTESVGSQADWRVRRTALRAGAGARLEPLRGGLRCARFAGRRAFDDGAVRFAVALEGAGSMDFAFDASTGELTIDRVRGTNGTTKITVLRLGGADAVDFGVGDSRLDRPIGAFASNCVFGHLELRAGRGAFAFADGEMRFDAVLRTPSIVRYDGGMGSLDVSPVDGSLALDTRSELIVGRPAADLILKARPSASGARVDWRQVRGPRLGLRTADEGVRLRSEDLPVGEEAMFLVGAAAPRAMVLESVFVRHPV